MYNTMSGKKERLRPREGQGNKLSMYCCGVTVYDLSHIGDNSIPAHYIAVTDQSNAGLAPRLMYATPSCAGHARVYCCFDVLYRLLQHLGYEVQYVRNFTDIDDKIIARAAEIGEGPLHLSQRYLSSQ